MDHSNSAQTNNAIRQEMTSARRHTDWMLFKRVMRQVRPYWLHIGGIFFLSLLSTPLALLIPVPLKIAVDSVIGSQPIPTIFNEILPSVALHSPTALLIFLTVLMVGIALLTHLQEMASLLLQTYAGEKMSLDFRAQLFHCVQQLSLSYHDAKGTADSTFRIQYDAPAIQHIATKGTIPFITASITFGAMIFVISAIDWQLALIALTISPILYFLTPSSRARLRARWTEVKEVDSSV
ncbi:MAG: ABC transporter transmembrane domain-containing protein, partial [Nitrospirae bacterium]|nr:ABC transporter transmembrane domain-containing protein [Nitrospirota bacterium]